MPLWAQKFDFFLVGVTIGLNQLANDTVLHTAQKAILSWQSQGNEVWHELAMASIRTATSSEELPSPCTTTQERSDCGTLYTPEMLH